MRAIWKWLHDNGLSVLFFLLFVVALVVQSVTGLFAANARRHELGADSLSYLDYLGTGIFLDGVFVNWQAALLQLACLILFGSWLYQRGASHSARPEGETAERTAEDARWPWLYRNSLSLAFIGLFLASFAAHVVFGTWAFNEARALAGDPPVSMAAYVGTAEFWFLTTQTWQAEFIAILFLLVLSIFLRQAGSAESKPVESGDDDTGEINR